MFQDFRHCFYDDRVYLWSITELSSVKEFLSAVKNKHDSNVVRAVLAAYEKQVVPRYPYFTKGNLKVKRRLKTRPFSKLYQHVSGQHRTWF